jgi:hypothetical protein
MVGNLPYHISSPLLFHCAQYVPHIADMHFMLQAEVVDRMVAGPGTPEYGRLTVSLQSVFAVEKLFSVPAGAFQPAPAVESAVVRLTPLGAAWMSFVAGFYGQGKELPGRAQNLPFFLSVLGLSLALIAASATPYRERAIRWMGAHLPRNTTRARLALVGLALLVLSPAAVGALWQLRQAPNFRREARAQFDSLANDPQPIAYVEPIATTPSLLFANPLRSDANTWPNTCLAKFFAKQAVLPKPDTHDE